MHQAAQAADRLAHASRVLVITGAGVSAESGVPTFRGTGGLWEGFRAEELATPEAFRRDPELVWRWYRWRRDICRRASPNAGHMAIVRLEQFCEDLLLVTQNVDGLHARAGSRALLEIHGNIDTARCTACDSKALLEDLSLPERSVVPQCPTCGGRMRPHILWFGETYWPGMLDRAQAAAARAQVVLVVGTSAQVWPPAQLALHAQQGGAFLVDINPAATELSREADVFLQGKAGEVLPDLVQRVEATKSP